jgi:hypothetical protein
MDLDWTKLDGEIIYRSFENFCYIIAKREYSGLGKFVDFDDTSKPGDGVEFYLELENNELWGWQAKFYHPDKKLNSSRKSSIRKSLRKALSNHPNLIKFYLCTPYALTVNDKNWFLIDLHNEVNQWFSSSDPKIHIFPRNLDLILWSENDYKDTMLKPENIGIWKFFFDVKEINFSFFKDLLKRKLDSTRSKYNSKLHQITDIEKKLLEWVDERNIIIKKINEFCWIAFRVLELIEKVPLPRKMPVKLEHRNLIGENKLYKDWNAFAEEYEKFTDEFLKAINKQLDFYSDVKELVMKKIEIIPQNFLKKMNNDIIYSNIDYYFRILESYEPKNEDFQYKFGDVIYINDEILYQIDRLSKRMFFIGARGGFGKTHLSCHLAENLLNLSNPVIFLRGAEFMTPDSLKIQLLNQIGLNNWSWYEFLNTSKILSDIYNKNLIIIIDGLNESRVNKSFNPRWKEELNEIIFDLKKNQRIKLILTSRKSYKKNILSKIHEDEYEYGEIYGFFDDVEELIQKYFKYYNITIEISSIMSRLFRNPLMLKFFCETYDSKNNFIQNYISYPILIEQFIQSKIFEIFRIKYLKTYKRPLNKKNFWNFLLEVAHFFWMKQSHYVDLENLISFLNIKKGFSNYFDILLEFEELFVIDNLENKELISYSYDVLGGFFISYLIVKENWLNKRKIVKRFELKRNMNLLYLEDIFIQLPLLIIQQKQKNPFLYKICQNNPAFFEIMFYYPDFQKLNKWKFKFNQISMKYVLNTPFSDVVYNFIVANNKISHPLNFTFLSKILKKSSMARRDCVWSQSIYEHNELFKKFFNEFKADLEIKTSKDEILNKIELIIWILTSNIRSYRNTASELLFEFSIQYPFEFFNILKENLDINDLYVIERLFGSAYGLMMWCYNNTNMIEFKSLMQNLATLCYDLFFKPKSKYSTTHILIRDHARYIIEIYLIVDPLSFNQDDILNIRPPYEHGDLRNWGYIDEIPFSSRYPNVINPLNFGNYTIGQLIQNRNNHDQIHPEYQQILGNILWRIQNLGYKSKLFGSIDSLINRKNYYRKQDDLGKIERYGKKYSWIAFYEMAGYRLDQNLVNEQYFVNRTSEFAIDVSFPLLPPSDLRLDQFRFDFNNKLDIWEWIKEPTWKDFNDLYQFEMIRGLNGPWILIGGLILQKSEDDKREKFSHILSYFYSPEKGEPFDYLGLYATENLFHHEVNQYTKIFAGELPWNNFMNTYDNNEEKFEVLSAEYNPEAENFDGSVSIPSIKFLKELKLKRNGRKFEFFNEDNEIVAISLRYKDDYCNLCYVRQDQLEKYAKQKNRIFFQYFWGEHRINYSAFKHLDRKELQQYQTYGSFNYINIFWENEFIMKDLEGYKKILKTCDLIRKLPQKEQNLCKIIIEINTINQEYDEINFDINFEEILPTSISNIALNLNDQLNKQIIKEDISKDVILKLTDIANRLKELI